MFEGRGGWGGADVGNPSIAFLTTLAVSSVARRRGQAPPPATSCEGTRASFKVAELLSIWVSLRPFGLTRTFSLALFFFVFFKKKSFSLRCRVQNLAPSNGDKPSNGLIAVPAAAHQAFNCNQERFTPVRNSIQWRPIPCQSLFF